MTSTTSVTTLDLKALKALTAAHERHQAAVSVLDTLKAAKQLSGQTITGVNATWSTELDYDKNKYEELSGLNVTFSGGLAIAFHLCGATITDLPLESDENNRERRDELESKFGKMTVEEFTDDLLALNAGKERSFSMTGDELRAVAVHVPAQAYVGS